MNLLLLNVLLAFGWCALFGAFTLGNLMAGLFVGFLALWVSKPLFGETTYFIRSIRVIRLFFFFLWELVVSSSTVAWDVLTPRHRARPGIIALPLDLERDVSVMALANLISLTPGSLSLDLSADGRTLYFHAMFADDPEALRRDLKAGMERRVREALE
jgi:multicomponent Na+:H+ antiporter subunit E